MVPLRSNPGNPELIQTLIRILQQSALPSTRPTQDLDYTFPRPLEEEPHNEHLQPRHRHNEATLHQAKVEDALLGALDSREIAVLARAEVLLVAGNCGKLSRELEDGFFEDGGLFGRGTLLGGDFRAGGFVFDLRG
jgi:hypothetical protein